MKPETHIIAPDLISFLRAEMAEKDAKILRLEHQIVELRRMIFGSKHERFIPLSNSGQTTLFEDITPIGVEQKSTTVTYERKEPVKQEIQHKGRNAFPESLPREIVTIEPSEDVKDCIKIGEEVSETLDYIPGKLTVIRRIRPKYVRKNIQEDTKTVIIADMPEKALDKLMIEARLLAQILADKYLDHLPLYRQIDRFARLGYKIPDSTMGGWVSQGYKLLEPLLERFRQKIIQSGYAQADESPIKVLDKAKKGTTHRGYYWLLHDPVGKCVLFNYQSGRDNLSGQTHLEGFTGYLQVDGYAVYESLFAESKEVILLNCMAHARREFEKALKNDKVNAQYALEVFQELYQIERYAKENILTVEQTRELRQEKSKPILEAFKVWLLEKAGEVIPRSLMGEAIAYTVRRFDQLCVYLNEGKLQIDNNLIENAVRPLAIGRKNYLFAGSHEAAKRAGLFYSLIGTCKMNQINPVEYLTDVIERINRHPINKIDQLLPQNWEKSQK
jgi:transposase